MPEKSILILLENYPYNGGVERVTTLLANYLVRQQYSVLILSVNRSATAVPGTLDPEVECASFPSAVDPASAGNREYLSRLIERRKISLIINQGISPVLTRLSLPFRSAGRPYVSVLHNSPDAMLKALENERHRRARITSLPGLKQLIKKMLWPLYRRWAIAKIRHFYHTVYSNSDAFVLLSRSFLGPMAALAGLRDTSKFTAIPNPLSFGSGSQSGDALKKEQILYIGRMDKTQKRVDRVIDIFKSVSGRYPGWTLVLVGDGPQLGELRQQAAGCSRIRFEGARNNPEDYFKESSVLLLTSEFEGFGMVLTEALQFGVVPVAYASYSSIHDIIRDGYNGYLAPAFDRSEFIRKLELLLSDPVLRRQMASNGPASCGKFQPEAVFGQWKALLDRLQETCLR